MTDPRSAVAAHLQHLEQQLLTPAIRHNPEALATLLADDFREFGSSGRIYTRPEIIAALTAELPRPFTLHDVTCTFPAPTVALLTYRSQSPNATALRSSLWVNRADRWQMLFHQGTRL